MYFVVSIPVCWPWTDTLETRIIYFYYLYFQSILVLRNVVEIYDVWDEVAIGVVLLKI